MRRQCNRPHTAGKRNDSLRLATRDSPDDGGIALGPVPRADAQATYVRGFTGTSYLESTALGVNIYPPSPSGAIGTTQYLEANNGAVTVLDQRRPGRWRARWSPCAVRPLHQSLNHRWLGANYYQVNLAVSDTADALGTWKSIRIPVLAAGVADYPTLALDDNAVYVSAINFDAPFIFTGASLMVIPKADLFSGIPTLARMTTFTSPWNGTDRGCTRNP